jgi:hypothetical protein
MATVEQKQYRAKRRRELRGTIPIPAIQGTDSQFLKGTHDDDGFGSDEMSRQIAYRRAAAAGVTPSGRYISQLADSLGDPKAWMDTTADARRACEQGGYSCDGAVKVRARPVDTPDPWDEPYEVADDVVQESVDKELAGQQVSTQERADLEQSHRRRASGKD